MRATRFIGLFIVFPLLAQTSQQGRFSVDYAVGCAPLTVNVTEHDGFGDIVRQYFFNDNPTSELTHTYDTPGTYYLVQLVGIAVDPKTDTLEIVVHDPVPPNFDFQYCDGRMVQVQIDDQNYDTYGITFAGGAEFFVTDQGGAQYAFATNDPLSIEVRGLYANGADNCAPVTLVLDDVFESIEAPDVLSAGLVQICEGVYRISTEATLIDGVTYEFEWSKNGGAFSPVAFEVRDDDIIIDPIVNDSDTDYCVRVNVVNPCAGARTIGTELCQNIGTGLLDPVRDLYSSYQDQAILISFDETELGAFQVSRTIDGTDYSTVSNATSAIVDARGFPGRRYFYRVAYQDTCDAIWGAKDTSPPFLAYDRIGTNEYRVTFSPAIHDLAQEFSYQAYLEGNGIRKEVPLSSNEFKVSLPATLGQSQKFYILGDSDGTLAYSNTLSLDYEFIVHVPKAFTPNNDGLNDRLEFYGLEEVIAELKIFNSWGQQVYGEISSAPSWDGIINGRRATEGVYVYEILIPEMGNHVQRGTFALIKK